MKTIRVAIIIGTRPEAIKMAPVYLKMKADPRINVNLMSTAQHRQMLDTALETFQIKPDLDLNLMQPNQALSDLAGRLILNIQRELIKIKPDVVLVHGDTSTCLYAALAAFYQRIPVGHVEAGLRTYNYNAPWPEEMHRRLTDPICAWCFAPTKLAADNLLAENIPDSKIHITGNTVIDALLIARKRIGDRDVPIEGLRPDDIYGKRLILVTGHRRENFGKPFEAFCLALRDIVDIHKDVVVVYPVHMNPNVRVSVNSILRNKNRVFLIEPLEYLPFVFLMSKCELIITDSGGIQEEAPSLHKPLLVTRMTTERPEAIKSGLAKLVGTSRKDIVFEVSKLLNDAKVYSSMSSGPNPYGDGNASQRIIDVIISRQ